METRLQLIEENFESQQSGKSDLLIHIGQETISYAIVDKGREQLKALVEYKATVSELEDIIKSDRYLNYFYRKIKIATDTFKFTFVPHEIYSESEVDDYAKFISPNSASDILVTDIRPFRIKNVTALDIEFRRQLSSLFQQPSFFSQADPFIAGSFKIYSVKDPVQLFINLQPGRLEICVIKEGRLLFYNLFESAGADDFNYFLLLVINQFNLNAACLVTVSGKTDSNEACYERLKKYFDKIEFADPCIFARCFETFNSIDLHRYFSLISLNLCE